MTCLRSCGQPVSESIGSPPITVAPGPELFFCFVFVCFFINRNPFSSSHWGVQKTFSGKFTKVFNLQSEDGPPHPSQLVSYMRGLQEQRPHPIICACSGLPLLGQRRVVAELVIVQDSPQEQNVEKRGSLCKFCQNSSQSRLELSSGALCPKPPSHSISFAFCSLCLQFTNDFQI